MTGCEAPAKIPAAVVLTDAPLSPSLNVKAFNHLLG